MVQHRMTGGRKEKKERKKGRVERERRLWENANKHKRCNPATKSHGAGGFLQSTSGKIQCLSSSWERYSAALSHSTWIRRNIANWI